MEGASSTTNFKLGTALSERQTAPRRSGSHIEFARVVPGRHQDIVRYDLNREVRQTEAEFTSRRELGLRDCRAIHIRPMPRTQVFHDQFVVFNGQAAMPPADPAIVDAEGHFVPPADFGGELVQNYLTRRSQRILADEVKFHGSGRRDFWWAAVGEIAGWLWWGGEKPALVMLNRVRHMSMAADGCGLNRTIVAR